MKRLLTLTAAIALSASLVGCASPEQNRVVGGAALGGAVGYGLSGGSTAGTVGGAALGGLIGNAVNQNERQRQIDAERRYYYGPRWQNRPYYGY